MSVQSCLAWQLVACEAAASSHFGLHRAHTWGTVAPHKIPAYTPCHTTQTHKMNIRIQFYPTVWLTHQQMIQTKPKSVYNPMKCSEALAYRYQYVNSPVNYTGRWKGRRDFKEKSDEDHGKKTELNMPGCTASIEGYFLQLFLSWVHPSLKNLHTCSTAQGKAWSSKYFSLSFPVCSALPN